METSKRTIAINTDFRRPTLAGRLLGEAPTPLVAEARRRGLVAIDGREVLLYQAIPQFRSMTGRELPLPLARQVLGLAAEEA